MAVVTPKGQVRVLDPATGKDALPKPESPGDAAISLVSFVNRRPDMLVLDFPSGLLQSIVELPWPLR